MNYRFGSSAAETEDSFVYVRIQAFLSKAAFARGPAQLLRVGPPVVGFLEPSSGSSKSAHLVGWDVANLSEWQLTSHDTFPTSPWEMCMGAIFCLPQLSGRNFPYSRLPKPLYSFAAAPAISTTYASPACPAEDATDISRGLDLAQRAAYAPALLANAPAFVPPPRAPRSPSRDRMV